MAVRLDVEPVKLEQRDQAADQEPPQRLRRSRLGLNFVRLSARRNPGPLVLLDDPLTLRYLCRA